MRQRDPNDISWQDQGTTVDCPYCKFIEPALQGTSRCPACNGAGARFVPARMMDQETAGREIVDFITRTPWATDPEHLRGQLLSLLQLVDLYQVDVKQAVIDALREQCGAPRS